VEPELCQTRPKALVGVSCLHGRQLLYLHGVGNLSSTRVGDGARAVGFRYTSWHRSRTCRARRRLLVGVPLVGNWSQMQPTSRRLDVLPVWVLTGVLTPPCPERLFGWHISAYPGLSWLISSHRILFILPAEYYSFYQPNTLHEFLKV
jgi:hypothetical protein